MTTRSKFKIEAVNWQSIKIENARHILLEAKDYLRYLTEAADKITARAFTILTTLLPIISALLVFIVNQKQRGSGEDEFIFRLLIVSIAFLVAVLFGLSKLVFPRLYMPPGQEPRKLCTDAMLGLNLEAESAKLAIVLNEIEVQQVKIDYNELQNSQRLKLLKGLMLSLGILFLVALSALTLHFT